MLFRGAAVLPDKANLIDIKIFDNKLVNTCVGIHLHNNMNNAFNNFISSQNVLFSSTQNNFRSF